MNISCGYKTTKYEFLKKTSHIFVHFRMKNFHGGLMNVTIPHAAVHISLCCFQRHRDCAWLLFYLFVLFCFYENPPPPLPPLSPALPSPILLLVIYRHRTHGDESDITFVLCEVTSLEPWVSGFLLLLLEAFVLGRNFMGWSSLAFRGLRYFLSCFG